MPVLTPREGFAGVVLCAVTADNVVKAEEMEAAWRHLARLEAFRGATERDLRAMLERLAIDRQKSGTDMFLRACVAAIPAADRGPLFSAAAAVVRADREVVRNERAYLSFLASRLGVAADAAEDALRGDG